MSNKENSKMSSNVIEVDFKKVQQEEPSSNQESEVIEHVERHEGKGALRGVFSWVINALWLMLVLLWPVLKWPVSIVVFIFALRASFLWDDPTLNVGWDFFLAFSVLCFLSFLVSKYSQKK